MKDISDIKPFKKKVWLSSPTMHGDELKYITEAYETNWMSTVGANINSVEAEIAEKVGCKYAVALSAGTAALHLATRLAGEKLYGIHAANKGSLTGHKVFASDMTFDATVNPIARVLFPGSSQFSYFVNSNIFFALGVRKSNK